MVHTELQYKQNKNLDFAKAVFESIISLPCKHGKLKCHTCYNTKTKHTRYYYKNATEVNQKKIEKRLQAHSEKQTPTFFFF